MVPRLRWYEFLHGLTREHLDSGARMLQVSCISDLDKSAMEFLSLLRDYSDVLLLGREDPWTAYQTQLKKLHDLDMLNLSLTPFERDVIFFQQV